MAKEYALSSEPAEKDAILMRRAIALAKDNVLRNQGGPFGCVVAAGEDVIAEGVNLVTATNDPSAHAEMVAIRRACAARGSFQLTGCTIYTSSEPCLMCLGAILWSRPDRVVYGCTRDDAEGIGFDDARIYREIGKPISERAIRMVQALRSEALDAFKAWKSSEGKVPY